MPGPLHYDVVPSPWSAEGLRSLVADQSDAAQVDEALRQTLAAVGRVDILINNTAIQGPGCRCVTTRSTAGGGCWR